MSEDAAGEALEVVWVREGECYGGWGAGGDGPVEGVVADEASVEGIGAFVVVFGDVVLFCASRREGEGAVLDPICVAADDGAEVCVVGFCVDEDRRILGRCLVVCRCYRERVGGSDAPRME